jgi:hypothetical protein
MGYSDQDSKDEKYDYLYPDEALYLNENVKYENKIIINSIPILIIVNFFKENLIIYHQEGQLPFSIQQSYETFFNLSNNTLTINAYKFFSNLMSYGYILRKPLFLYHKNEKAVLSDRVCQAIEKPFPIINKKDHGKLTKKEIFKKLNDFIPSITIDELKSKLAVKNKQKLMKANEKFNVEYDVYLPNKKFKKTDPANLLFKLTGSLSNNQTILPKLSDHLMCSQNKEHSSKSMYAFVNKGDILFYLFNNNFQLPSTIDVNAKLRNF